MATIGTFTRTKDGYTGSITTLTLNVKLRLDPNQKSSDKAPDFRIFTSTGQAEIGAAWAKSSSGDNPTPYLSLQIDDPSFAAPLYANLFEGEDGKHHLVWTRHKPKAS